MEKDNKGNIIREYDEVIMDNEHPRIDGWFLCIAPIEKPATRYGGDCRRRRLRIEICCADCGGVRFESKGAGYFKSQERLAGKISSADEAHDADVYQVTIDILRLESQMKNARRHIYCIHPS